MGVFSRENHGIRAGLKSMELSHSSLSDCRNNSETSARTIIVLKGRSLVRY